MPKFYFTYGTDGQPFHGGWTEIEAQTIRMASFAFQAYHPDKTPGLLNCADVYTEEYFKKTEMFRSGNFNAGCHEIITLRREAAHD